MISLQTDCPLSHLRHFLRLKASLPLRYGPFSLTAPLNWRSLLLEALAVHVLHCVTYFSVLRGPESFKGSCRLQGSVYVVLPPSTAVIGYVTGFRRLVTLFPTTATLHHRFLKTFPCSNHGQCHNWLHHRFLKTCPSSNHSHNWLHHRFPKTCHPSSNHGQCHSWLHHMFLKTSPSSNHSHNWLHHRYSRLLLPPTTPITGYIIRFQRLVILPPTMASATIGYIIGFSRLLLPPATPITGYIIGFQRLVILPPTMASATIGYIIGFQKLVRWLTVSCCVQVAVSLWPHGQLTMADHM